MKTILAIVSLFITGIAGAAELNCVNQAGTPAPVVQAQILSPTRLQHIKLFGARGEFALARGRKQILPEPMPASYFFELNYNDLDHDGQTLILPLRYFQSEGVFQALLIENHALQSAELNLAVRLNCSVK